MSTRDLQKRSVFAEFTQSLASLSTCKRLSVGCIIIPSDFTQVLALGYNGVPARLSHTLCSGEPGTCGCIHAEMNAIAKLNTSLTDLTMITTVSPCKLCAGLIINTKKIGTVMFMKAYRDTTSIHTLASVGIKVVKI